MDEMKYTKKRLQVPVRDGPFLRGGGGRGEEGIGQLRKKKKRRKIGENKRCTSKHRKKNSSKPHLENMDDAKKKILQSYVG